MSKNECKRCSECKHYERVNDNEPEDHGDCTLYPIWVDVWAAHYCGQWAAGETVKEEAPVLDIDWKKVPKEYNWVAQDFDGGIYACEAEPRATMETEHEGFWSTGGLNYKFIEQGTSNPDWRNTLTKRPRATSTGK